MHVYIMCMSADTPLSAALSQVKVPPAHDTCVLQALAPSIVVIMQAMFLTLSKNIEVKLKRTIYIKPKCNSSV